MEAYHGKSGNFHQQRIDSLKPKGYRIISLSIYDTPDDLKYAAVWDKRTGPDWEQFHGKTSNEYQKIFDDMTKENYRPIIITATGKADAPIFAGVFEKDSTPFLAKHGLVKDSSTKEETLRYWLQWARDNEYIMRWAAVYGDQLSPAFAIILEKNKDKVSWGFGWKDDSLAYQERFEAQKLQWSRPYLVTSISKQTPFAGEFYLSLFRDDCIGPWKTKHDMTSDEYQFEIDHLEQGYYPWIVQGGGETFQAKYSAIFVKQEKITPRKWTVTGTSVPSLSKFDDYMKTLMQENNIRAGSLAIARNGRLVFAHGYTWAEPGYPVTEPSSSFRILSMSKTLTSIAIHQFIEKKRIGLASKIQAKSLLRVKKFDGGSPTDPRWKSVRIWHLLSHVGGWNTEKDWTHYDFEVAKAAGKPLPVTKGQVASYVAEQADATSFDPGNLPMNYSNFGYTLLGLVVKKISGKKYHESVLDTIFKPLGIKRAKVGRSLRSLQLPDQVRHHTPYLRTEKNVMGDDPKIVPWEYGGWNVEKGDSGGGWIMAPADYAKVLASFDLSGDNPLFDDPSQIVDQVMWSNPFAANKELLRGWFRTSDTSGNDYLKNASGTPVMGVQHNGGMDGGATLGLRRSDKLSFVLFLNFGIKGGLHAVIHGVALNEIANKVTSWPSNDLFPEVGIPSFS